MFWIVWNTQGRTPTMAHTTEISARNEAERLARLNPNNEFHVLKWVDSCRLTDVRWKNEEDSPF